MTTHWHSGETQIYWTCKALIGGRTISHIDEIGEVQGWRLGAIICALKRKYDWPIRADYKAPENVAYYTLAPDTDWRKLKFPQSARSLLPLNGDGGFDGAE